MKHAAPVSLGSFWSAAAACAVLAAVGVAHVWVRSASVESSYLTTRLVEENRDLRLEQAELRSRVSALRSPQRLDGVAKRRGLGPPPAERILVLVGGQPTSGDRAIAERR